MTPRLAAELAAAPQSRRGAQVLSIARIGGNFRLDALQAAVLRVKLPHLAAWTDARRRNADRYRALVREFGLDGSRSSCRSSRDGYRHIYNQFVICAPTARRAARSSGRAPIGTEIYYPVPFHRQECFAGCAEQPHRTFPVADRAAETSLALPIYGELTADQQRHVVASIAEFYGAAR